MRRFVLDRVFQAAVTLLALSILVFLLARMAGDPTDLLVPMDAPMAYRTALRQELGLDQPYHIQYWAFITHAVRGDFGDSIQLKQPAMDMVLERLPNSLRLGALAIMLALLASFPLGVLSASHRGKWIDQVVRIVSVSGVTMPAFLVGILLMQLLSVRLQWVPTAGMSDWSSYIMPALTLALFAMASLTRLLRSSMIEVLDSDFIKLARLKGASERAVIWRHALGNSLIPVLTMGGVYFALLVTMAVVVETIFSWPGIGRLSYEAIMRRDFPIIQAVVIVAATLVIAVNLLVDIAYAYLDPRIRRT